MSYLMNNDFSKEVMKHMTTDSLSYRLFPKLYEQKHRVDLFMDHCQNDGMTEVQAKWLLDFARERSKSHPITMTDALFIGIKKVKDGSYRNDG